MADSFLTIGNGQAVSLADVPRLTFTEFSTSLLADCAEGASIVQYFAWENQEQIRLVAVIRNQDLQIATCDVPDEYPALTVHHEAFHLFERELAEQYAIRPTGHPWLKPLRYHANYRGRSDIFGNHYDATIPGNYEFFAAESDEIHQVAVGPVHAGIIEPGHFRFNCAGERVLHLEIQLGYQHRGVERMLASVPARRLPIIIEGIAGDTAMGNSISFAQAIEALSATAIPHPIQISRTLVLELERLANHIGDLGALSGDAAFLPPSSYYGRIRGEFLNMLLLLSGNRFGKGLIRPGRSAISISPDRIQTVQQRCRDLRGQIKHVGDLLFNAPSVLSRFENVGTVAHDTAQSLGLVGPAGRASGMDYDVRTTFPTGYYRDISVVPQCETTGDVWGRAHVRMKEIMQSLDIIDALPAIEVDAGPEGLSIQEPAPSSLVVTLNEGWRGELSHCVITDETGGIDCYKIKDPSFHNWMGLAMALRNQEISDFPLCNKSFNLSYCGFDL